MIMNYDRCDDVNQKDEFQPVIFPSDGNNSLWFETMSIINNLTNITLKVGLAGESVVGSYSYRDEVEKLLNLTWPDLTLPLNQNLTWPDLTWPDLDKHKNY